jgi:hypothetical protein
MPGNIRQNKDKSYIDVKLERHIVKEYRMPAKSGPQKELVEVVDLIAKKEYCQALVKLNLLDQGIPFVRKLTIECLWQLEKDDELADFIMEPNSIEEFAYLSESLWRRNKIQDLRKLVAKLSSRPAIVESEPYRWIMKKLEDRGP